MKSGHLELAGIILGFLLLLSSKPALAQSHGPAFDLDIPEVQKVVEGTVENLLKNSPEPNVPYRVRLVADENFNAFVSKNTKGDGILIQVFTGALHQFRSVDQMAGVLAHELGHYFEGHLAIDQTDTEQRARAFIASQHHEREADKFGLKIMIDAGYNPQEIVELWRTLSKLGADQRHVLQKFVASHPGEFERAFLLDAMIKQESRRRDIPSKTTDLNLSEEAVKAMNPFAEVIANIEKLGFAGANFERRFKALEKDVLDRDYKPNVSKGLKEVLEKWRSTLPKLGSGKYGDVSFLSSAIHDHAAERPDGLELAVLKDGRSSLHVDRSVEMEWRKFLYEEAGWKAFNKDIEIRLREVPELKKEVETSYRDWLEEKKASSYEKKIPWRENAEFLRLQFGSGRFGYDEIPPFARSLLLRKQLEKITGKADFHAFLQMIEFPAERLRQADRAFRETLWLKGMEFLPFEEALTWLSPLPINKAEDVRLFEDFKGSQSKAASALTEENKDIVQKWLLDALEGKTLDAPLRERMENVARAFKLLKNSTESDPYSRGEEPLWRHKFARRIQDKMLARYPSQIEDIRFIYENWIQYGRQSPDNRRRATWAMREAGGLRPAIKILINPVVDDGSWRNMETTNDLLNAYQGKEFWPSDPKEAIQDIKAMYKVADTRLHGEESEFTDIPAKIISGLESVEAKEAVLGEILSFLDAEYERSDKYKRSKFYNWGKALNRELAPVYREIYESESYQRPLAKLSTPEERVNEILALFGKPTIEGLGEAIKLDEAEAKKAHERAKKNSRGGMVVSDSVVQEVNIDELLFSTIYRDLEAQGLKSEEIRSLFSRMFVDGNELRIGETSRQWLLRQVAEAQTLEEAIEANRGTNKDRVVTQYIFENSWSEYDPLNPPEDVRVRLFEVVAKVAEKIESVADFELFRSEMNSSLSWATYSAHFPGSESDKGLSQIHRILMHKYGEIPEFQERLSLPEFFRKMVVKKGESPMPSSYSDRIFEKWVLPKLRETNPKIIEELTTLRSSRDSFVFEDARRQRIAKDILFTTYVENQDGALKFIEELYPEANHLRDELVSEYTRKTELTETQLERFSALYAKDSEGSWKKTVAMRAFWPVIEELSREERMDILLWLTDLAELKKGSEGFKAIYRGIKMANEQAREVVFPDADALKATYLRQPESLQRRVFIPFFVDSQGFLGSEEYRGKLQTKFLEVAKAPKMLEGMYKAFLTSLDDTSLALFYADIFPELHKYKKSPEKLAKRIFESLGVVGIKMGQILAEQSGLIPEEYQREFRSFKDRAMPLRKDEALRLLSQHLNRPWQEVFTSIGKELGSASIKVVYEARLKNGEQVVVKIQRDGLVHQIRQDLLMIDGTLEEMTRNGMSDLRPEIESIVRELRRALDAEIDFIREAQNAETIRENQAKRAKVSLALEKFENGNRGVRLTIPKIYTHLSNEKVMVEGKASGVPLTDLSTLRRNGIDPVKLSRAIVREMVFQIFYDGFVDPDRHGGNFFAEEGELFLIDFGQSFKVTSDQQEKLLSLFKTIGKGSAEEIAGAWFELTENLTPESREGFTSRVRKMLAKESGSSERSHGKILSDLMKMSGEERMILRDGYFGLFKTLSLLQPHLEAAGPGYFASTLKKVVALSWSRGLVERTQMMAERAWKKTKGFFGFGTTPPEVQETEVRSEKKSSDPIKRSEDITSERTKPSEELSTDPEKRPAEKEEAKTATEREPSKTFRLRVENGQTRTGDLSELSLEELLNQMREMTERSEKEMDRASKERFKLIGETVLEKAKVAEMAQKQIALAMLAAIIQKRTGNEPHKAPGMIHQMGAESVKFSLALFVALFLDAADDLDADTFLNFLTHLPVEQIRLLTFGLGSSIGTTGFDLVQVMTNKLLTGQSGRAFESALRNSLRQYGSRGHALMAQSKIILRTQVGFVCGIMLNKLLYEGYDEHFWDRVTLESTSFMGAQVVVKGARTLLFKALQAGKIVSKAKVATGPVGLIIGAVELGFEMYLAGKISRAWTIARMKAQHEHEIGETLKAIEVASAKDPEELAMDDMLLVYKLRNQVQNYLMSLTLFGVIEEIQKHQMTEVKIDENFNQVVPLTSEIKILREGGSLNRAYIQKIDSHWAKYAKKVDEKLAELRGNSGLNRSHLREWAETASKPLRVPGMCKTPQTSVACSLAFMLAEDRLNNEIGTFLKSNSMASASADSLSRIESRQIGANGKPLIVLGSRITSGELFEALGLFTRRLLSRGEHPLARNLATQVSDHYAAWLAELDEMTQTKTMQETVPVLPQPMLFERGLMDVAGYPELSSAFKNWEAGSVNRLNRSGNPFFPLIATDQPAIVTENGRLRNGVLRPLQSEDEMEEAQLQLLQKGIFDIMNRSIAILLPAQDPEGYHREAMGEMLNQYLVQSSCREAIRSAQSGKIAVNTEAYDLLNTRLDAMDLHLKMRRIEEREGEDLYRVEMSLGDRTAEREVAVPRPKQEIEVRNRAKDVKDYADAAIIVQVFQQTTDHPRITPMVVAKHQMNFSIHKNIRQTAQSLCMDLLQP